MLKLINTALFFYKFQVYTNILPRQSGTCLSSYPVGGWSRRIKISRPAWNSKERKKLLLGMIPFHYSPVLQISYFVFVGTVSVTYYAIFFNQCLFTYSAFQLSLSERLPCTDDNLGFPLNFSLVFEWYYYSV
jgi:hypothetical protein